MNVKNPYIGRMASVNEYKWEVFWKLQTKEGIKL